LQEVTAFNSQIAQRKVDGTTFTTFRYLGWRAFATTPLCIAIFSARANVLCGMETEAFGRGCLAEAVGTGVAATASGCRAFSALSTGGCRSQLACANDASVGAIVFMKRGRLAPDAELYGSGVILQGRHGPGLISKTPDQIDPA
jgi:hypothetical protein